MNNMYDDEEDEYFDDEDEEVEDEDGCEKMTEKEYVKLQDAIYDAMENFKSNPPHDTIKFPVYMSKEDFGKEIADKVPEVLKTQNVDDLYNQYLESIKSEYLHSEWEDDILDSKLTTDIGCEVFDELYEDIRTMSLSDANQPIQDIDVSDAPAAVDVEVDVHVFEDIIEYANSTDEHLSWLKDVFYNNLLDKIYKLFAHMYRNVLSDNAEEIAENALKNFIDKIKPDDEDQVIGYSYKEEPEREIKSGDLTISFYKRIKNKKESDDE